jgi:hypothetical protein
MTIIKHFIFTLWTLLVLTSCSHDKNNTETGEFWYKEIKNPTYGQVLLHNHINTYTVNGHFYVHLIANLPVDKNEYYTGTTKIYNDTLSFDFQEKRKFSLSELFSSTVEINAKLTLYNLYFSSIKIPKTVCWGNTPIDSIKH